MAQVRGTAGVLTAAEDRVLRRTLLRWLVVVVVLVTVVSSVANWVVVDREPQAPVEAWLGGIADGRSRQLLSRTGPVMTDPTLGIVSNRVHRSAAGRISGHEILDVRPGPGPDRAEVRARVWWDTAQDGRRRAEVHSYGVHRVPRTGPFNDRWELDSPDVATLSIRLPATLDEISVNGQAVRPDAEERAPGPRSPGGTWRFEALPGTYAIDLPRDSYYRLAAPLPPATIAFRDPRPVSVALRIEPAPRMWRETDERIEQWLEECMESQSLDPEGCPSSERQVEPPEPLGLSVATTGMRGTTARREITDVRWRLLSRPALVLVESPGDPLRWSADPYRAAEAQLSYREDGERVTERVEFPVRATVRSTGRSAEISVGLGQRPPGAARPSRG